MEVRHASDPLVRWLWLSEGHPPLGQVANLFASSLGMLIPGCLVVSAVIALHLAALYSQRFRAQILPTGIVPPRSQASSKPQIPRFFGKGAKKDAPQQLLTSSTISSEDWM